MADRYVKTTGADANSGINWQQAFKTIQKGIDDCALTGGGTVHVEHGYYQELVQVKTNVNLLGYGAQPGAQPIESPSLDEGVEICPNRPILDGNSTGTVITCNGIQNSTIENFNIIRGKGSNNKSGGGIYIKGQQINVNKCCILENVSEKFGGGICIDSGSSTINFDDDLFWNNSSHGGGGTSIFESKIISIKNCLYLRNSNTSTQGKGGGAIFMRKCENVTIDDVEFTSNSSNDLGGGVFVSECHSVPASITFNNCKFNANSTRISGGGIMINAQSFISVVDVEFVDNKAERDGGGVGFNNRSLPNAIVFNPAAVRLAGQVSRFTNCSFLTNTAGDDAGGLYLTAATMVILEDCSFKQNVSRNNGGGVHCTFGSAVEITDCSFEHNLAQMANGGGVSLRNSDLVMTDVSLVHNVARQGKGGGVYIHTESDIRWNQFLSSWGFIGRGGAKVAIENSNFNNNFSRSGGGGFGSEGTDYPITAAINNCDFTNNRSQNAGFGGGIFVYKTTTRLTNNSLDRNQVFLPGQNARGGAVAAIECPNFTMTGGTVSHNRAQFGGGVAMKDCPNTTVTGVTFNANSITLPPGSGDEIHSDNCTGVTAAGLINANTGIIPGKVEVIP